MIKLMKSFVITSQKLILFCKPLHLFKTLYAIQSAFFKLSCFLIKHLQEILYSELNFLQVLFFFFWKIVKSIVRETLLGIINLIMFDTKHVKYYGL